MSPQALNIRFLKHQVRVTADDPDILDTLGKQFRHLPVGPALESAQIHVERVEDEKYQLHVNGDKVFGAMPISGLFDFLMMHTVTELNRPVDSALLMHGAAVAREGQGVLMCGASGSGKSTLAAWLVREGYDYLTDEVVALAPDGASMQGIPRSVVLKKGSTFLLDDWFGTERPEGITTLDSSGTNWVDPEALRPDSVTLQAEPALLLFPRYRADSPTDVTPLTGGSATFKLMELLVNARNLPDHGLRAASAVAKGIPAYEITYSNLEAFSAWLGETLPAA